MDFTEEEFKRLVIKNEQYIEFKVASELEELFFIFTILAEMNETKKMTQVENFVLVL